jgi:uncharacterized protein (TIGR03437 family)
MKKLTLVLLLSLLPSLAVAQTLDNSSLTGKYYFVHLLVSVSPTGAVTNTRNLGGSITFDGMGGYTFGGRLGSGVNAPADSAGVGVYTVGANAFVTLTNPIVDTLEINGRLGENAEALIGSSTEAPDGSSDLFVAIKAPPSSKGIDNSTLTGSYTGSTLFFPGGSPAALTSALLWMDADGAGAFTSILARGHIANGGDVNFEETNTAATYALGGDGSGTAAIGATSALFSGAHDIFVSADGNYLIGFSTESGGREIFVAARDFGNDATNASWTGSYWIAEMIVDLDFSSFTSGSGGLSSTGTGVATISERLLVDRGSTDFSVVNTYTINADSTGQLAAILEPGAINMGIGARVADVPHAMIGAQINGLNTISIFHGIFVAVRMPALSGPGVFLNPVGVVNAASFAPPTFPISAGSIISLFGTGMAGEGTFEEAQTTPLPTTLAGVVITINGVPAPIFFVKPTQINVQVPFATSGAVATIVVANRGVPSNTVAVPLAASSPGIFAFSATGLGPGIIVHSVDFRPVTAADPTAAGQFVSILLTGLGELNPPLADGVAAPVDPLSFATDPNIQVLFGFEATPGEIQFQGAAPFFVGLYQINVRVPQLETVGAALPIAILTGNAFSDFVTVAVEF